MNQLINKDCLEGMREVPAGSADLIFADPPFNISYDYHGQYDDQLHPADYLKWSADWMQEVHRILSDNGTFWLAIGDEWSAQLRCLALDLGFHPRSWVIWYYTFGVNCTDKYTRSHAHLHYFTKHKSDFVFNKQVERVPSARTLIYKDKRANPAGRLPDDTWILRPQELDAQAFPEFADTWHIPRIAGTFKQRLPDAPNQMPEQLLGRIIRHCSLPDQLVADPFVGTGTTLVVAKKLGRCYLGWEQSARFAEAAQRRLDAAKSGDPLTGPIPQGTCNGSESTPGTSTQATETL